MKHPALVLIKPDGISKKLVGHILLKFAQSDLDIVAMKIARATRRLAEEHYRHIKGQPFFDDTVAYMLGAFHRPKKLIALIYYGNDAIKKCRKIAGATNPEEADPLSVRGSYGRITRRGVYENVVHVSSNNDEAKREIMLWFEPDDITVKLYKTKIKMVNIIRKRVWA